MTFPLRSCAPHPDETPLRQLDSGEPSTCGVKDTPVGQALLKSFPVGGALTALAAPPPALSMSRSVGGVQSGIAPVACPELVEGVGLWGFPQKDTLRAGG